MFILSNPLTLIFCLVIFVVFFVFLSLVGSDSEIIKKRINRINSLLRDDKDSFDPEHFFTVLENSSDNETKHLVKLFRNSVGKCIRKNDRTIIYGNKGKADDVFNEYSLAKPLFYTRFFIPSALTGLGVLGTFVGLLSGLIELDINNFQDTSNINYLMKGAGTAFITSVFGVFFSLLSNSFIAYIQREIRKHINTLVENIDLRFTPNISSSEYIFVEEEDTTIQGCIRKLGNDLSEIFIKSTSDMTTQLGQEIGKYLKEMDDRATDVIVKTLDGLQERLNEGITQQVKAVDLASQKFVDSIRDATNVVSSKYEDIGRTFNTYASQLESDVNKWRLVSSGFGKYVEKFEENISLYQKNSLEDRKSLIEVANSMNEMIKVLQTSEENIKNNVDSATNIFKNMAGNISTLRDVANNIRDGIDGIKDFEPKINSTLEKSFKDVSDFLKETTNTNNEFVKVWVSSYDKTIKESLEKIKDTIASLGEIK